MDAQETSAAVAHQDAARALAEAPVRQPRATRRRRSAPTAAPRSAAVRRSGRTSPTRSGRLALAAQPSRQRPRRDRAGPRAHRRGAGRPVRARQVPGRHHALLHQPHRPEGPRRPDPPPGHPARAGAAAFTGDDGGLARRGPPFAGAGPRPSLPRPRADARHDPVRDLLPLLHPEPHRRRPDPELQPHATRGPARLPAPHAAGPRRADLRRRRPDARPEALRDRSCAACATSPHRDHPHRVAGSRVPARSASTTSSARCSRSTTRCG